jgi:hypothetical protein
MTSKKQGSNEANGILQEIAEEFRQTIFNQHNLLDVTKNLAIEKGECTFESLTISIARFNDDLFKLYERLNDLLEAEVTS